MVRHPLFPKLHTSIELNFIEKNKICDITVQSFNFYLRTEVFPDKLEQWYKQIIEKFKHEETKNEHYTLKTEKNIMHMKILFVC